MPQPEGKEEASKDEEGDAPGHRNCMRAFEPTREHHEKSLPKDGANAIEGGTDADVQALVVCRETEDIEAVSSDVMCGAGKGQNPEEC